VALKLWQVGPPVRPASLPRPHPNLARFLGAGEWDGRPYQVFEWADGTDLASHIRTNGRPDLFTVCRLGAQVAAGLAVLHVAGLVHGDVKPHNIIVAAGDGGLTARLIDLGGPAGLGLPVLATPFTPPRRPSPAGGPHLPPTPTASGLCCSRSSRASPRPGLRGLSPSGLPASIQSYPPGLNQLVARLTDPDPARRPPDLEEVAELLSRWAAPDLTPTVPLRPTSWAGRRPPPSPGRRLLRAGVLTALVLGRWFWPDCG